MSAAPTSTSERRPSEDAAVSERSYHLGFSYVKSEESKRRRRGYFPPEKRFSAPIRDPGGKAVGCSVLGFP